MPGKIIIHGRLFFQTSDQPMMEAPNRSGNRAGLPNIAVEDGKSYFVLS